MTSFRRALVVFLKAPVPGAVKTRLTPALTPEEATGLYRALARDSLEAVRDWADLSDAHRPWLAYEGHGRFADPGWTGFDVPFFAQEGANLGERLDRAFRRAFDDGHGQVAVLGTDAPEITVDRLAEAFRALERFDAVLGPARDGGFYLLGLRRPCPGLLADVPWSTGAVLEETSRRLDAAGFSREQLEILDDVDVPEDVTALARRLGNAGPRCRHTREALLKLKTGRIP